jgi:hypothetical protein
MRSAIATLIAVGMAASGLLAASDAPLEQVQATHTERMDFPSGGTLKMLKSTGDLTIEGWDRADMEVTTVQSTKSYHPGDRKAAEKSLDRIKLVTARQGNEVSITTEFPKHALPMRLFRGVSAFELHYVIKVPRNAKLIIEHDSGNVYIDDIAGDVHVTNGIGQITMHMPQDRDYAIDAKTGVGAVDSDFAGPEHGRWFDLGHSFVSGGLSEAPSGGAQKLYARIGVGDIAIMKIRQPSPPPPLDR